MKPIKLYPKLFFLVVVSCNLLAKNTLADVQSGSSEVFLNQSVNGNVTENPDYYFVSDIIVSSTEEDKILAQNELFAKAKSAAFLLLKAYLNNPNLVANSVEAESLILRFVPVRLTRVNNAYIGYFAVTFDKGAADTMFATQASRMAVGGVSTPCFKISIAPSAIDFISARNCLRSAKIPFSIISIMERIVEIGIPNYKLGNIESILSGCGLSVIPNNDILFIKAVSR